MKKKKTAVEKTVTIDGKEYKFYYTEEFEKRWNELMVKYMLSIDKNPTTDGASSTDADNKINP